MPNDPIAYVPFGLDKGAEPGKIRIRLAFESGKPDAGKQEMILSGDGHVRLLHSRSSQDPKPRILEGTCDAKSIMSLLDFMEGNGVLDADSGPGPYSGPHRVLELILPGRLARIVMPESDEYTIEQMVGAVKLAAAQCLPEALNHRFFPNL